MLTSCSDTPSRLGAEHPFLEAPSEGRTSSTAEFPATVNDNTAGRRNRVSWSNGERWSD